MNIIRPTERISVIKKLGILLLVLGLVTTLFPPVTTAALSAAQLQVYSQGIYYYDTEIHAATCLASTTLTGSVATEMVYNFLISKGLKPIQAAAVMGNLQPESGMNPRRVQGTPTPSGDSDTMALNGSTGYGIAQWTSLGRQKNLHDAAVKAGKIDGDLGVQLDYLWQELSTGYKSSTLTPLLASTDIRQATSLVMINFEAPLDQSQAAQDARAGFAIGWLTKYGSNTAPPATTPTPGPTTPASAALPATAGGCSPASAAGGGGVAAVGGWAMPVDKKFYVSNPEWFTKPHHDYPAADIPVPSGTPIFAVAAGKITAAPLFKGPASQLYSTAGGYGLGVQITGTDGTIYIYGHGIDGGSVPGAHEGDTVKAGQLIMHSNTTGASSGPHLHFEIRFSGVTVCPQNLLVGIAKGSPPALSSLPSSGCTN